MIDKHLIEIFMLLVLIGGCISLVDVKRSKTKNDWFVNFTIGFSIFIPVIFLFARMISK